MKLRLSMAIVSGTLILPAVAAEAPFPNRPIRMLVPYPAGGSLDLPGRAVGLKFADATGQQLVLDNRGGAGGLIAGEIVARATPDGYTLILASNGQVSIAPALYPKLAYDPATELVPITHFVDTPMVLFANAAFPAHTVKDLIAMAKAEPGRFGVALAGVGGVSHLTLELFKIRANINLLPVPYRGAGAAMGDIAGGTVPMIFTGVAAAKPLLDTGRARAIAVCSRTRTGSLPNVPTFEELGYPGMDAPLWIGMMAPKGTPERIIAKLDAEFRKALAAPDVRERLAAQSADIVAAGPREFGDMIRRDTARWREVVKTANIKID
jgi:tripartite-type tricarboxylate transporter receptor subunit TctC